jgi:glutamate synthase domain-containing protein 1
MDQRAYVVIGSHPWDRDESDPAVSLALRNAYRFCETVEAKLGPPSISGGTTSKPERVIMLYWETANPDRIAGIYVTFTTDGTCEFEWNDGKESREIKGLSLDELMALDVPQKYKSILTKSSRPHKSLDL